MKFIHVPYEEFLKRKGNRKVIQFGASSLWHYYLKAFPDIAGKVLDDTLLIVDNDPLKQGGEFAVDGRRFPVKGAGALAGEENYVILVTASLVYQKDICAQLSGLGLADGTECYSLPLMAYSFREADNSCVREYFKEHTAAVNRPMLHTFWFSGEEKPDLYKKCIESQRRYCPGFEIVEWNAQNYDVTKNRYMREAFERRKWAFVSDYARLDVIYRYGGIYMDMDVELLAPITRLLAADSFFCRQEDGFIELGSGFGAKAGDALIGEMLDTYKNRRLIMETGKMDMTAQPEWLSSVLDRHGIGIGHNSGIAGNRLILSNDYITCSTEENPVQTAKLGIHWHNGGWLDEKDRRMLRESYAAKDELAETYFKTIQDVEGMCG